MNSTTASIILMDSLLSEHPTATREIKIKAIADFCQSKEIARLIPKEVFERLAKEMFEKLALVIPAMIQPTTIAQFGQNLKTTVDGSFRTPLSTVVQSRFNELFDKVLEIFTTEVLPLLKAELSSKGKGKKTIAKPKEVPVSNERVAVAEGVTKDAEINHVKTVLRHVLSLFAKAPVKDAVEANRYKALEVSSFFRYSWIDKYLSEATIGQVRYCTGGGSAGAFADNLELLVDEAAKGTTFPHNFDEHVWMYIDWFFGAIVPELRKVLLQLETTKGAFVQPGWCGRAPEAPVPENTQGSAVGDHPNLYLSKAWAGTHVPPPAPLSPFAVPSMDDAVFCAVNRLLGQPLAFYGDFQRPYSGMWCSDGRAIVPNVPPIKKLLQVLRIRQMMAAQVALWVLQLLDQHNQWGDAMQAALNSVVNSTSAFFTDPALLEALTPSEKLARRLRVGLLTHINDGDPTIVNTMLDALYQTLEPLGNF